MQKVTLLTCILAFMTACATTDKNAVLNSNVTQESNIFIPDEETAYRLTREGSGLSIQEVNEFENQLKNKPDNLTTRARLLGYYFRSAIDILDPEVTKTARRRHILWVIQHYPESDLTMLSDFTIDPAGHPLADAEGYHQAKKLWLKQIDKCSDDSRVFVHAARFFLFHDNNHSINLLKCATQLEPDNQDIASMLGYTYAVSILGITLINDNGLPLSADPAAASSEIAKNSVKELRTSSNPVIIAAAGRILNQYGSMVDDVGSQDDIIEELLLRAEELDINNPELPLELSKFYSFRIFGTNNSEDRMVLAKKALLQAEKGVELSKNNRKLLLYALNEAAKAAFEAKAIDKAVSFSDDLLEIINPRIDRGTYFHSAHVVLGRAAIRKGDIEQAKSHLLLAGNTLDDKSMAAFGPNMSLAKELSEQGEFNTVIKYLKSCRTFWDSGQIDHWIKILESHNIPDFGANLWY